MKEEVKTKPQVRFIRLKQKSDVEQMMQLEGLQPVEIFAGQNGELFFVDKELIEDDNIFRDTEIHSNRESQNPFLDRDFSGM